MDSATILSAFPRRERANLIAILQVFQKTDGYISPQAVREISRHLHVPISHIYGVATFYRSFSLEPRGRCCLSVCVGTACHVRGAFPIVEELQRRLCIKPGETTPDRNFTLETVNCLGACALGPVVVVNEKYHGQMDLTKTGSLLNDLEGKTPEIIHEETEVPIGT